MDASPSANLALLQKGGLVQVAPGLFRPVRPGDVPEIVLARLESAGNGAYRLVPAGEAWARLDSTTVSALGFPGRWDTLLRLGIAGFIEIVRPAPGTTLLNLASWWGHLKRCSEDPWFWDDPRRRETYLAACREIQQRPAHKTRRRHKSIVA